MKKNAKHLLILLLVLVQVFVLCGCASLDEMRENQAFLTKDGDILWNGNVYKKLPACDYLEPEIDFETDIYVTDPDVPVLLSESIYHLMLSPTKDGNLLANYRDETSYYCVDSMYDTMRARITAPFIPDIVCYYYYVFDPETHESEIKYYTLTQEQLDIITQITETAEPIALGDGFALNCDYKISLLACSEDLLLQQDCHMAISQSGDAYYLLVTTDAREQAYKVPAGNTALFNEIVEDYLHYALILY